MTLRWAPILVAGFLGASVARADTLKSEADLRPFADKVMAALVASGIKGAFAVMGPYVVIPQTELQSAMLTSQAQRDQYGARFGKTTGFEYLGQKKVGQSLVRLTYIEKTEKHAMPWHFTFYRTNSGWVLNSFLWNDQVSQLFNVLP
jgi:hypothetical protein